MSLLRCADNSFVLSWPNNIKVYASICIIRNLLSICNPEFKFEKKLRKVLRKTVTFYKKWSKSEGYPDSDCYCLCSV